MINLLSEHVPHQEVWAFGSRVSGRVKPYSDLDLAVISERPLGLGLANLKTAFSESDLPFKVDVVEYASAGPEFRKIIDADHALIWPTID